MKKKNEYKISILILMLIIYPLFMPRSLKLLYSPLIDGIESTNELYVVCGIVLIMLIIGVFRRPKGISSITVSKLSIICFLYVCFIVINTLINTQFNEQNIYAMVVTVVPLMFLVIPQKCFAKENNLFIKFASLIAVIYSLLAIYNTTHSSLNIGNAYVISASQARVSLPIGSPTTVVFYFIASLPLVNLSLCEETHKVLSLVYRIGFWLIILASLLSLSRAGAAVIIVIAAWCLYNRSKKTILAKRILGIFVLIAIGVYATSFIASKFDFSRLFMGFSDSSVSERTRGTMLFLEIFKHNPVFGSGCGEFFTRVYTSLTFSDRIITAYGKVGLVDPHNGFVLMLSENGIIGFIFLVIIIYMIYKHYSLIADQDTKSAALQLLAGIVVYTLASSDLFNLIGLTSIIYLYLSYFISVSRCDYIENREI
ncbi:MAG: O-antigen ligase family protein [Clostridiales bacterium]|nr:O-antigen ligase family protein [Clostridiales bacterium]